MKLEDEGSHCSELEELHKQLNSQSLRNAEVVDRGKALWVA